MKLMHLNQSHLSIPDINYDCTIRMSSTEFARVCRDLSQFGDTMAIAFTEDGKSLLQALIIHFPITMYILALFNEIHYVPFLLIGVKFSVDGDVCNGTTFLHKNDEDGTIIKTQESTRAEFSCRHLNLFTKATPLSTRVQLSMSSNAPLMVEYSVHDYGHIRYYLAPKVEEDSQT